MAITFEHARNLILDNVSPPVVERLALLAAGGLVVAEDIHAPWDLPRWDNSAMDGFAVRVADCSKQTALLINDYIPAGGRTDKPLQPGCAAKIMTGAPVPEGCDAIVPFEETQEQDDKVVILGEVRCGDHIRICGEDVQIGELTLPAGTILRPSEISMLASFGMPDVAVYRRPKVAILSTGDELVMPGENLGPGQIFDSNSQALAVAVKEAGAEPVLIGIASDEEESLREKISEGLKADVLISSAGVSAGDRDKVREILDEQGVQEVFWKVDIKPGRPTAFGLQGHKPVFSLPGNPVSSMVTFEMLVRPALLKMMGHRQTIKPLIKATLAHPVEKKAGRVQFLRMTLSGKEGCRSALSSGDQNTGILKTMVRSNGIAVLPADRCRFEAGEEIDVHSL
jgi:molybdopterin molybdotransferase